MAALKLNCKGWWLVIKESDKSVCLYNQSAVEYRSFYVFYLCKKNGNKPYVIVRELYFIYFLARDEYIIVVSIVFI